MNQDQVMDSLRQLLIDSGESKEAIKSVVDFINSQNDIIASLKAANSDLLNAYQRAEGKYDGMQILAVEKERIPENALLCEAYVCNKELIVLGDPDWNGRDGDESGHNCDLMGCGSLSHVVLRLPLESLITDVPE